MSWIGLVLFIHVVQGGRRRVVGLWEADGERRHRQVFAWNPGTDTFGAAGRLRDPARLARYKRFLQDQGIRTKRKDDQTWVEG